MTLDDAIQRADYAFALAMLGAELKAGPDPGKLFMCAELKGFLEDFDGALRDLVELERQLPGRGFLAEFGHVLTNGQHWCRRQTMADFPARRASMGTDLPEWSTRYGEAIRRHARAEFALAKQELDQAGPLVTASGGELFFVSGDSMAFTDLRDADELTGPHLVCSHTAGLLDIPFSQLAQLEFIEGRGYQDHLWKPARVKTWGGDEVFVRVYAYYVGTGRHESEFLRQLRMTECKYDHGYAVAWGQRDWQFFNDEGRALVGVHRVARINFRRAE